MFLFDRYMDINTLPCHAMPIIDLLSSLVYIIIPFPSLFDNDNNMRTPLPLQPLHHYIYHHHLYALPLLIIHRQVPGTTLQ